MRKSMTYAGILAATAGMLATASPAMAAEQDGSQDNDGINVLDNSNIHLGPLQLCGNNVAVLGAVLPIGSPLSAECQQAAQAKGNGLIETGPQTNVPQRPQVQMPAPQGPSNSGGSQQMAPAPTAPSAVGGAAPAEMPLAPSPSLIKGHHAVTG